MFKYKYSKCLLELFKQDYDKTPQKMRINIPESVDKKSRIEWNHVKKTINFVEKENSQ